MDPVFLLQYPTIQLEKMREYVFFIILCPPSPNLNSMVGLFNEEERRQKSRRNP